MNSNKKIEFDMFRKKYNKYIFVKMYIRHLLSPQKYI